MTDYAALFRAIETSLFEASATPELLRTELAKFRYTEKRLSDEELFDVFRDVTFASGFNAETMNKYRAGLRKHFPNIATAAQCSDADLERIRASGEVIGNRRKLKACVENAKAIQRLASSYGSLQTYIDSFAPFDRFENIVLLKEALDAEFSYLGPVTTFHFMTDIGLPVLKPDRVIMRLFQRLHLVESESQFWRAIFIGRHIAEAVGEPIRYVDIVLVTYGQARTRDWGIQQGICLEKYPKCSQCRVSNLCRYYAHRNNLTLPL